MPLIVDTYNVLHVVGVLPPHLAGVDAAGLAGLIGQSRHRQEPVTLVCDGRPVEGGFMGDGAGVTVIYSGPDQTADDVIVRLIAASSDPRRLIVVSSDRAIIREARRRRCAVQTSETFLAGLAADHEALAHPAARPEEAAPAWTGARSEVDRWLAVFNVTAADLTLPPEPEPEPEPEPKPEPQHQPAPEAPAASSPPSPGARPSRPLLSADIVREAEALLAESESPPASASEPPGEPPPAVPAEAGDRTPRARVDPLFPRDLLAEAVAIEDEARTGGRPRSDAAPAGRPAGDGDRDGDRSPEDPSAASPAPLRHDNAVLPKELLAEADAMWRAEQEAAEPPDPDELPDER